MGICCSKQDEDLQIQEKDPGKAPRVHQVMLNYADLEPMPAISQEAKIKYKSVKGDKIDDMMGQIINKNNIKMPVYRIYEGKYLLGTESKQCLINGTKCVVRVGGGFESLEEYLKRN